jgi:hypothetical protein
MITPEQQALIDELARQGCHVVPLPPEAKVALSPMDEEHCYRTDASLRTGNVEQSAVRRKFVVTRLVQQTLVVDASAATVEEAQALAISFSKDINTCEWAEHDLFHFSARLL